MSLETRIKEAFERHATDARPGSPDAWKGIERRVRRSHRVRMAGSAMAAAIVVAGIAVAIPRLTTNRSLEPDVQPTSAPSDVPVLSAKVSVNAIALAAGEDSLWALSSGEEDDQPGTLTRIDPGTNRITGNIKVGVRPSAIAVGEGSIWVLNGDICRGPDCPQGQHEPSEEEKNSVWRIDPRTLEVKDTILVFGSELTIDSGYGWTLAYGGLARIDLDPDVVEPVSSWGSTANFGSLALGGGNAWVAGSGSAGETFLSIVDLEKKELVDILDIVPAGVNPDVAFGFGSAWVTSAMESSASGLIRFDGATHARIAQITLPDAAPVGLTTVTTGYGYVWAGSARGNFWKVDPNTNTATIDPILVGDAPPVPVTAIVTGFKSVWVASGDGKIWRFDP